MTDTKQDELREKRNQHKALFDLFTDDVALIRFGTTFSNLTNDQKATMAASCYDLAEKTQGLIHTEVRTILERIRATSDDSNNNEEKLSDLLSAITAEKEKYS